MKVYSCKNLGTGFAKIYSQEEAQCSSYKIFCNHCYSLLNMMLKQMLLNEYYLPFNLCFTHLIEIERTQKLLKIIFFKSKDPPIVPFIKLYTPNFVNFDPHESCSPQTN